MPGPGFQDIDTNLSRFTINETHAIALPFDPHAGLYASIEALQLDLDGWIQGL